MVSQVNQLASDLPGYQSTLQSKIQSVRGVAGGTGTLERASEVLQSLGQELDKPKLSSPSLDDRPAPNTPIPVEVKQPDPGRTSNACGFDHAPDPSPHDNRGGHHIRDLHSYSASGFAEQARSSCRCTGSSAHDRCNRRCWPTAQSIVSRSTGIERRLRSRDWNRTVVHRRTERSAVGNVGDDPAVRALHRRGDRGNISSHPCGGSRSWLDDGVMDRRIVSHGRANRGTCHRAFALRP